MKIAHMALWTQNLEQQARFWVSFFDGKINEKYCSKPTLGLNLILSKLARILQLS
jgi:lactoylglutathione lyase